MIRHCIINTNTNKVINIIDYETQQTGVPLGFETEAPHLLCVANDVAGIDWDYINNEFIDNRPRSTTSLPQE
jgi:hypothetical protein